MPLTNHSPPPTNDPFDLSGSVALVSGASSGLGTHFATLLAEKGAVVFVAARRKEKLAKLAAQIQESGGRAIPVAMDVCDPDSVAAAFDLAESEAGVVDLVCNNAGIAAPNAAADTTETEWASIIDTNLTGMWRVARESGSRMLAHEVSGSIVNTASMLGLRAARFQSAYCASKSGVIHLTRCLALEWGRKGVRVNALCPGYFETEMNAGFLDSDSGRRMIERSVAGRPGTLEEISAPFLLLASKAGSFVNGASLLVDGGHGVGNI